MKEMLNDLTTFFNAVISWIPIIAKAALGAIGDFLNTLDYATAIIIGIFALIRIGIGIIKRWLNR